MSREKAQRKFYKYPDEPPAPVGYIIGPKLLNDLLPVWWGERAHLKPATLFGCEAGWETKLGTLEQHGQILGAIDKTIADAQGKHIEFSVEDEGRDRLESADRLLLDYGLRTGKTRTGSDDSAASAKGKALVLRERDAKDWLSQLQSPHVLPKPLKRSNHTLPEKGEVSLCELVTWLADGKALQSEDDAAQSKAREAEFIKFQDRRSASKSPDCLAPDAIWPDSDKNSFARLVAEELARHVRIRVAKVAIVEAMRDGEVRGYADGPSGSGQREPIPNQVLEHFVIDGNRLSAQTAEGPTRARWENVIFERNDLIRLWGDAAGEDNSGAAENEKGKAKGGAPRKNNDAVASFHRLFSKGKPINLGWFIIAKRISKDIRREISHENLTAALRGRGRKASNNWRYEET